MKTINIVIGANYGDEGKGLVTNAITDSDGIVILANGGAQRGHTVKYEGKHHVFHHFGSATLKGTNSYACKDFILNPIQFNKELQELSLNNFYIKFFIDPSCRITTIYDMMANTIRSKKQGTASTGFGIKETLDRYNTKYWFNVSDFVKDDSTWRDELDRIRKYYLSLDWVKESRNELLSEFYNDRVLDKAIDDLYNFFNCVSGIRTITQILKAYNNITIECGQGLALDTDYDIKFGTPTHTGSDNLKYILDHLNIFDLKDSKINRHYVSRTYLTRHGNGDLPNEDRELFFEDKTNIPNEYQGSIRFAKFNKASINELLDRLEDDKKITCGYDIKNIIVFTHVNELTIEQELINKIKDKYSIKISNDKEKIENYIV